MIDKTERAALGAILDARGLRAVLETLGDLCLDRAALATDTETARAWLAVSRRLTFASFKATAEE